MYQAITVKLLGATNHKPARMVVRAQAGRKIVSNKIELNTESNVIAAAKAYAAEKKWGGLWQGGCDYRGDYVFTCSRRLDSHQFMITD